MDIEELYALTNWIDQEIGSKKIVKRYQLLQNILNQNSQANQARQPFEQQKSELLTALGSVSLQSLTIDQLNFLEKLGIASHVGESGVHKVEDILVKNPIDVATAASKIDEIIKKFNQAIEKSNQLKTGLKGCVDPSSSDMLNEILVRVSFSGRAAMANIVDFKKWGSDWHDIGRGIAMIHSAAPEDIRIVGAKKGSIIIELAVIYGIAKTVGSIIFEALKITERVLEIRKKAEEIRGLKLNNDKIEKELEQEAEREKTDGVNQVVNEVVNKFQIKTNQDGDQVKALETSVRKLVAFLEKGGEVDCVIPEGKGTKESDAQQLKELRDSFASIRALEVKIRQIEHKKEQ
jgi:hypothetical protein